MDMMAIRRRVLMASKKKRLPSEYQEVEWIQGNGGYIKTDYIPDVETSAKIKYERTRSGGTSTLFGLNSQNFRLEVRYGNRWYGYAMGYINYALDGNPVYGKGVDANTIYEATIDENGLTVDGYNTKGNTAPFNITKPIALFGGVKNDGSVGQIDSYLRIYSFMLSKNGQKVFNLVPCYRKSDGEIGMYDTVSETFYTNSGTGTFTKGADV